jgi:hypothetical protein
MHEAPHHRRTSSEDILTFKFMQQLRLMASDVLDRLNAADSVIA